MIRKYGHVLAAALLGSTSAAAMGNGPGNGQTETGTRNENGHGHGDGNGPGNGNSYPGDGATTSLRRSRPLECEWRRRADIQTRALPGVQAVVPKYDEKDEHIVRRLGWALVTQWNELPDDVRELLAQQATFVENRYRTAQGREHIDIFLKKHAPEAGYS